MLNEAIVTINRAIIIIFGVAFIVIGAAVTVNGAMFALNGAVVITIAARLTARLAHADDLLWLTLPSLLQFRNMEAFPSPLVWAIASHSRTTLEI